MKYSIKIVFCILLTMLLIETITIANSDNAKLLLKNGKTAIENGKYEEAVNRLGELLTLSGNKSDDPEVIAFGATVQAYGLLKLNNPQMTPMAKQYLEKAVINDPKWAYPKELLKKINSLKKE